MEKDTNGYEKIKEWMATDEMKGKIARSLGKNSDPGSWIEAALTAVRMSADLMRCEPMSLMGALFTISSMGLRLEGPLGQAYMVARPASKWNPKTRRREYTHYEAQVQVGYKGLIDLAWRNPEVQDVESHIVYDNDDFNFALGSEQFIKHQWDIRTQSRGDMLAVYSGLRFKGNYYSFRVYPIEEILELRSGILKQNGVEVRTDENGLEHYMRRDKNSGNEYEWAPEKAKTMPWIGHVRPMIMKTAIRWSAKYWQLNPDFERAAALIGADEAGLSQRLSEIAKAMVPGSVIDGPNQFSSAGLPVPQSKGEANTLAASKALTAQMVAEVTARQVAKDAQVGTQRVMDSNQPSQPDTQTAKNKNKGQTKAKGQTSLQASTGSNKGMTKEEAAEIKEQEREEWEKGQSNKGRK